MFEVRLNRAQDLRGLRLELGLQVEALDPGAVHLGDALALWEELDAVERSAACAKTLLAGRVAEAATWKRAGFRSAAEQLATVAGSPVSTAHRMLETSDQVKSLPATAAAMRSGRLSRDKAEVIASAPTVDPDAESDLLAAADLPLAAVREKCLAAKGKDRDRAHKRIKQARSARDFEGKEGAWKVAAQEGHLTIWPACESATCSFIWQVGQKISMGTTLHEKKGQDHCSPPPS